MYYTYIYIYIHTYTYTYIYIYIYVYTYHVVGLRGPRLASIPYPTPPFIPKAERFAPLIAINNNSY